MVPTTRCLIRTEVSLAMRTTGVVASYLTSERMVNTILGKSQLTESSLHLSQVTASTSSGELTVLEKKIILGIKLNLNFKYRSMQNSSGLKGSSYLLRWRLPLRVIQLARLSVRSSEEKLMI